MLEQQISLWSQSLRDLSAGEMLSWSVTRFDSIVFTTAFGREDQVIAQLIADLDLAIELLTLDTGRHFEETYQIAAQTQSLIGRPIRQVSPDASEVEDLVATQGWYGFRASVANRRTCCHVRKVAPLKRALAGHQAWVTGLRREQSDARSDTAPIAWDAGLGIVKLNPLWDWTGAVVDAFLEDRGTPRHPLNLRGYPSVGCAPCTRAVSEGEHARAGRWWWETSERECGLHWHGDQLITNPLRN